MYIRKHFTGFVTIPSSLSKGSRAADGTGPSIGASTCPVCETLRTWISLGIKQLAPTFLLLDPT